MKKLVVLFTFFLIIISFFSCDDSDNKAEEPHLIIKFQFDPNQARLNNLGQPASVASGNAAQTPVFNAISAHYFELAPTAFTQLGNGTILYHAPETIDGGEVAIDFERAIIVSEGETFLKIPLSQVAQGNYEYVRVSLSYHDYNVTVRSNGADNSGR